MKTLHCTGIMATRIKLRSLTRSEQMSLWQDFLPLKQSLLKYLSKTTDIEKVSFRGGWKRLNLREARKAIPNTPEIKQAVRAMEKLIKHNTAMVVSEAHRKNRLHKGCSPEDLIQAGHIGLVYALYLYEPFVQGKSIKFSSYAYRWIKALIQEEVQTDKLIKPPSNEREYGYRFVSAVHSSDGDSVDVFEVLERSGEGDSLLDVVMKVLSHSQYIALVKEPLEAMIVLGGISWDEYRELRESGRQRVLAACQ